MTASIATNQTILVVGGGIGGMTAALEAAECGKQVILIERRATLGGRTALLYRYFPKMCHPSCGMEINLRRLKGNRNVRVMTMTEVLAVTGQRGDYTVQLKRSPRYVNANCTACGECTRAVAAEIDNPYEYNLSKTRAAYLPHSMAYPMHYVIDPSIIGTADADRALAACKYDAIELDMQEENIEITAGSIVWATGWKPYDAAKIQPYGYDRFANVITSVEFERLASPHGPTGGKLLRPSDGSEAKNIAFIQCAGSRDENHLRHCSRICCMASLKQTHYVREAYGDAAKSTIYYIDIRVIDRLEDFYRQVQQDQTVTFIKSKVAKIVEDSDGNPVLHGVDTEGYHRYAATHDLVVLAVGMEPETCGVKLPDDMLLDSSGFIESAALTAGGIFGAGAATGPLDVNRTVQSATAGALRAMQVVHKTSAVEGGE